MKLVGKSNFGYEIDMKKTLDIEIRILGNLWVIKRNLPLIDVLFLFFFF